MNGDGVVDVQDLVHVAQEYGKTGTNTADVNGDEVVDVDDFILVAAAVDTAAAAAPAARAQSLHFTAPSSKDGSRGTGIEKHLSHLSERHRCSRTTLGVGRPGSNRAACKLSEPVQPGDMDTYHLANDTECRFLSTTWTVPLVRRIGSGASACGILHGPQSCGVLGRPQRVG